MGEETLGLEPELGLGASPSALRLCDLSQVNKSPWEYFFYTLFLRTLLWFFSDYKSNTVSF